MLSKQVSWSLYSPSLVYSFMVKELQGELGIMQGQIIQGESKPELLFLLMIYCPIIRYSRLSLSRLRLS